ncbi:MAG: hypothetical protein Q8N26_13390 [Myxococcales bacterium]|nr:hypothetical protein [Myxococcales bacterium]
MKTPGGRDRALGLGVEAAVTTLSPFGTTWGSATIGVSPRFTLTPEHSPVAFTVLATVFTGYSSLSVLGPMGTQTVSGRASGGIALEKRFFDRLAIRIQAQLARVTLSRTSSPLTTGNQAVGSVINASFVPSPSIELRLYL